MVMGTYAGSTSQLGSTGDVTLRPSGSAARIGLDIALTSIPQTFDGLPISVSSLTSTFSGLRFPATCPSTPAPLAVSADSYDDATTRTASAPLRVTGCASLPYAPAFKVTAARDSADSEVKLTTDVTQAAGQATSRSVALAFPPTVLEPNGGVIAALCPNPALGTYTPVGTASSTSPLFPAPLTGKAYLTGSLLAPQLALVFGPPFSLTLTGAVSLTANSTTFTDIPDFPLSDLSVTLTSGPNAVFQASCNPASGTGTATLTDANGDHSATVPGPFTVSGCPASPGGSSGGGSGSSGSHGSGKGSAKAARPSVRAAFADGLAAGRPALLLQLLSGSGGPKLSAFTITLPSGLRFATHRVHGRLTVRGITLTGGRIKSLSTSHGRVTVTLRAPSAALIVSIARRALVESRSLRTRARRHRLGRFAIRVAMRTAGGRVTTVAVTLRTAVA
jgi:hypothetical protein